jgi:hypothetical protein
MTQSPSTPALHERRFRAVVVGGLVTMFALVALAPHIKRALFEERRLTGAFAAMASNPVAPLLRRFGTMEPEAFARAFRTGRPVPATQTVLSGLVPPAALFAPVGGDGASLVTGAGMTGVPSGDGWFRQVAFVPGAGVIGTGIAALDPTGTAPDPPGGPTDPVSPIPEPASWLMIVSGMALTGFVARRARIRPDAIA